MSSRERVLATLEGKAVDRIASDFRAEPEVRNMSKKLKYGLIGCGGCGEQKHLVSYEKFQDELTLKKRRFP